MKELEGVPNIVTRTLDVTKDEQVTSVVAGIVEAEGKIDCIVNNAGGLCIGVWDSLVLDRVTDRASCRPNSGHSSINRARGL
jgi:NADP-dependent 3-hydroxy acid dehydrogenase YdfG